MEMQYKEANGMDGKARLAKPNCTELVVRSLAMALTITAAVVLGVNRQHTTATITLISVPVSIPVTAKWFYLSAFVYCVVANAIAGAYAAISLVLALAGRSGKKSLSLITTTLDLVMVALLFSAVGASGAVGLLGLKGNKHVQWNKVCYVFGKFCHQAAAAVVLSLLGSIAFVLLILLSVSKLHKKF